MKTTCPSYLAKRPSNYESLGTHVLLVRGIISVITSGGICGIISGSNSPETTARDASGLSRHVEDARVRAVFERTKGEHWVFWFLFPRLSRAGGFGRRGGVQKVQ